MTRQPAARSSSQKFLHRQLKKNISLKNLYKDIQKDLSQVEEKLLLFTQTSNRLISEISSYLFQKTGKRIRPALLMLCSKLCGYKGGEHILMSTLVEAIHTASLIHDDIIDNSDIRRGRESVHARWGPNITVLLGDYLYIKSIGLSLDSDHRKIIKVLTDITANMIEGELNEYYVSGSLDVSEKEYLDTIHKKTASLFSASCQIGGIIAHAPLKTEKSLVEFGQSLGMSFQIIDDLLDYIGDPKDLGKPVLSDISEGRITLPLIYTLNNDGHANRKRMAELLSQSEMKEESRQEILEMVKSNGALDYTFKKAEEFSIRSKKIMDQFPPSVYRDTMTLFSDYILTRKR
ncbi:MAG: polyprenyl synthetase family protein [Candidatus Aminicenantes bacterium]